MKIPKQVPTLEGVVIVIASAVILFGGVFTYQYFALAQYNFEFQYPKDFLSSNQQPKLLVGDCDYGIFPNECPNINNIVINDLVASGGDIDGIKNNLSSPNYWDKPNGEKQKIGGVSYCLYKNSDAGMGKVYSNYYYATVKNKKCVVVFIATSTTNCDFYLPLEKGNTEQVKNYNDCLIKNKNQPEMLKEIINTFKFSPVK
ncbi:MAG: hypothetical protein NTY04_03645 [Candidatus Staskawiczbacteria bacterium]|nr:hypothetical protein [Candidatus Staskawiczbacteria bacterium]